MFEIGELLNGGWSASTDMPLKCKGCKKDLNPYEFYYCDNKKVMYCPSCVKSYHKHPCLKCEVWHIVKVEQFKKVEADEE